MFYDKHAADMHVHGVYDIYSSGQVRTLNVSSFRGSKYVSNFFWRLIQEDDSAINTNIQVIDFNSQRTKLLSQNATFNFFFDPVGFHFWK